MIRPRTLSDGGWIAPIWKDLSFHGSSSSFSLGRTEPTDSCAFGESGRTSRCSTHMHVRKRKCACARDMTHENTSASFHIFMDALPITDKHMYLKETLSSEFCTDQSTELLPHHCSRKDVSFRISGA